MGNPALTEFQATLAEQLADALLGKTAAMMVAEPNVPGEVQIAEPVTFTKGDVVRAVEKITTNWRAKYNRDMIRDADGVVQNGMDLVGPVREPATTVVRLEVSTHLDRTETPAEIAKREEQEAAYFWKPEEGPPPKRVTSMQLLNQDIWWVPKNAAPLRLADMADSHRRNLARFLCRNAAHYKQIEWSNMLQSMTGPLGPSGDAAIDSCERELDMLEREDPLDWLGDKPLMQALVPTVYLWQTDMDDGQVACHAVREDGLLIITGHARRSRSKAITVAQPPGVQQEAAYRKHLGGIGPAFYRLVTLPLGHALPEPTRIAFEEGIDE